MEETNTLAADELLHAWLGMSLNIRANRILRMLSFNQMALCSLLRLDALNGGHGMTAADLCASSKLLKSQMNKELASLEKIGLIVKEQAPDDKRKILIRFNDEGSALYDAEHERVMQVFGCVVDALGVEAARDLSRFLLAATEAVDAFEKGM